MSSTTLNSKGFLRAFAAIAVMSVSQPAMASTITTIDIIDTQGPLLVNTETRIITENGKQFEETVKTFRTDTTTRTTTKTSRKVIENNTATYDFDVEARFRDTKEKAFYNTYLRQDSAFSTGSRTVAWGTGSNGPSSFTYAPATRDNAKAGQHQSLGWFNYQNNTIKGGITDTVLDVRLTLGLESGRQKRFDFNFDIAHTETWDWFYINGVPDTFSISDERNSWRFTDGDTSYTFSLLGFHDTNGWYNQSATVAEGYGKRLNLKGILTSTTHKTVWSSYFRDRTESTFTTETMRMPIAPVPLPAGAPLLLGGLGVLAIVRKRRKAATA